MHCYDREITHRIWTTLLTLAAISQLVRCESQKICPVYCICNLKSNLNHADCSAKRLISPYSAVPPEVQSLDLSYNDITVLDNDCFKGYIHLINITISNNAIHTIFLETFVPLKRMRSIDLSYNRLEFIDPRLFESNRKLQTLNLAGNKFTSLSNEPLLRSRYLRAINLAHAQLNMLLPQHYSELPKLQELDLAHNLIITIDKFAENAPKLLRTLNLEGNNLNCDQSLQSALKELEYQNVQVSFEDCQDGDAVLKNVAGKEKKFERLELVDEHAMAVEPKNEENIEEDFGDSQEDFNETIRSGVLTGWNFPIAPVEDEDYYTDFDVNQSEDGVKILTAQEESNSINFVGKQYTDFDLLFVFICGIAVGVALTVFVGSCIVCIWRCSAALKASSIQIEDPYDSPYAIVSQAPRATVDAVRSPAGRDAESTHEHVPIALPQPPRRRQRRTSSTQRALVRYDQFGHSGGDNFISRLFGRPARHQYYRTINDNTAHLIRRLSRSNLFNNRLSQHFGDRERNTPSSLPNTPDSPDVPDGMTNGLEDVVTSVRTPHRRRPETPPPLYSEIVTKGGNSNS